MNTLAAHDFADQRAAFIDLAIRMMEDLEVVSRVGLSCFRHLDRDQDIVIARDL